MLLGTSEMLLDTFIAVGLFHSITSGPVQYGENASDGRTVGRTVGRTDGRTDGRSDGRSDGRTGGRSDLFFMRAQIE